MKADWKLFVDTGGTFTDAIGVSPAGEMLRAKVLSDGTLRGKVLSFTEASNKLLVEQRWSVSSELIKGFHFRWNSEYSDSSIVIQSFDAEQSILMLDQEIEIPSDPVFSIFTGEEAPILAARLLTNTSLEDEFPPLEMRLGFTKGTNALLERKGAPVLLITNQGFEDLPLIGNQQRPEIFALEVNKPLLFFSRTIGLPARMDAAGHVLQAPNLEELTSALQKIENPHELSVAIALIHSYLNPDLEQQIAKHPALQNFKYHAVSHELSSSIGLVERMQTTLVDAYIGPIIRQYLDRIKVSLGGRSLKIMSSAGGLMPFDSFKPKDSLLSGPAGGVVASAHVAKRLGISQLLTLDMGGTSTDVARYDDGFEYKNLTRVGDASIFSPSIAIETVAAGGGSICDFDGIALTVGPESAGASPGPACYGAGGPLTITDVNLLLGRVAPEFFNFPVQIAKSREAFLAIRGKMPKSDAPDEEILDGFLQLANEKMAEAIRKISIRKGFDPKPYTLLAFGGAGGQHACGVANILGIRRIIAPYNAGLLSAEGIGLARAERFASKQVLQPLPVVEQDLPHLFAELSVVPMQQLAKDFPNETAQIEEYHLFMRLQGQETPLQLHWQQGMKVAAEFETAYRALYHHWPQNKQIEVESIRIIARGENPVSQPLSKPQNTLHLNPDSFTTSNIPVYRWEALAAGSVIAGPALVVSSFATFYAEPGWEINVYEEHCLIASKIESGKQYQNIENEQINLSLFTHRFQAIAEDMGALLERTAFSVNVKERLDFSCALMDPEGYLIANAPHIPVHLGSLGVCIRSVLASYPLGPGDVIVTNHPAYGGSHLPDVTMMMGAFDRQNRLIGYLINRAHHAEIGGKTPGSMPADARYLKEEGVIIPPTYLIKNGISQWPEIQRILTEAEYPTRSLTENIADLSAALASLQSGKKALEHLAAQHTTEVLHRYMEKVLTETAGKIRRKLEQKILGILSATEYLDDGSQLSVAINPVKNGGWVVDFTGSSGVHPGNFNATSAIVQSVLLYVLRLVVAEPLPLNEGLIRDISIRLPEGMLNPPFEKLRGIEPAVVGGNTEVSQRLTDTLLKAFGLAACSQGTMNNLLFGNARFGFYETIAGGVGATPSCAGADGVHQHMTNTRITDPEIMELRYPIRLHRFGIRRDSGGKGLHSGGDGVIRTLEFLDVVSLTMLTQHRVIAPYGMEGGEPGKKGAQWLRLPGEDDREMPGCFSLEVPAGAVLRIETPGGGAWGKTPNRD